MEFEQEEAEEAELERVTARSGCNGEPPTRWRPLSIQVFDSLLPLLAPVNPFFHLE